LKEIEMSDSSIITFSDPSWLDPSLTDQLDFTGCHQSWKKFSVMYEQDELVRINSLNSYAFGLTKAKNQVTATLDENGADPLKVKEYVLSANIPASMVGNNALIENLVYPSTLCSMLMVQKHLLLNNVHVDVVKGISLEHARLSSVTMTYLFKFPSSAEAKEALDSLTKHARMIFCHGRGMVVVNGRKAAKGKEKNVQQYGGQTEFTTYINDPDFHVTAYVKPGKRGETYAEFDRPEDSSPVYAVSETCVRVEVKLSSKWLVAHELEKPLAWKGSEGKAACEQVLEELRRRLRVDEGLRRIDPQQRHLDKLSPVAKKVAQAHLAGDNIWLLPVMKANRSSNAIDIRQEILSKLHIDLEYPWSEQRGKADPKLTEWLRWDKQYQVPTELARLCMVSSTLKAKFMLLKAEVQALMATKAKEQASARANAKKSGKKVPSSKNKLLMTLVKQKWLEHHQTDYSQEESDISALLG
jgi:hypothetical protein